MIDERIVKEADVYYTNKVKKYKKGPQAVDWNSIEAQEIRFEQIAKLLPEKRDAEFSVCDYGCGMGELYNYLKQRYERFSYFGMDASKEMIENVQKIARGGVFVHGYEINVPHDYVVASGIFNVRQDVTDEKWNAYILEILSMFDRFATKGFAFNCLTKYSDADHRKDYLYYADPLFLFDYCKKNFSKNVALLHDYGIYDFTIIVRKDIK